MVVGIAKKSFSNLHSSEVYRELERRAVKKGFFDPKPEDIVRSASVQAQRVRKLDLRPSEDLFVDIAKLASALRSKGLESNADEIEQNLIMYKQAESALYGLKTDSPDDLSHFAHRDGDVDIVDAGDLGMIETVQSAAAKILSVVKTEPKKDKVASAAATIMRLAADSDVPQTTAEMEAAEAAAELKEIREPLDLLGGWLESFNTYVDVKAFMFKEAGGTGPSIDESEGQVAYSKVSGVAQDIVNKYTGLKNAPILQQYKVDKPTQQSLQALPAERLNEVAKFFELSVKQPDNMNDKAVIAKWKEQLDQKIPQILAIWWGIYNAVWGQNNSIWNSVIIKIPNILNTANAKLSAFAQPIKAVKTREEALTQLEGLQKAINEQWKITGDNKNIIDAMNSAAAAKVWEWINGIKVAAEVAVQKLSTGTKFKPVIVNTSQAMTAYRAISNAWQAEKKKDKPDQKILNTLKTATDQLSLFINAVSGNRSFFLVQRALAALSPPINVTTEAEVYSIAESMIRITPQALGVKS